ncbi:MAG: hypothetical protein U0935_20465 [Pirellulales bacterium]
MGGIRCLGIDAESKWLAVGGTVPKNGGSVTGVPTVLVFDFATGELRHTLTFGQPNDCFVSDLAFHPRGWPAAADLRHARQRPVDFAEARARKNQRSLRRRWSIVRAFLSILMECVWPSSPRMPAVPATVPAEKGRHLSDQ